MRILLTRPRVDAKRFAGWLAAAGHEVLISPVIGIEALNPPLPSGPFDAIVASSANAFECADPAFFAAEEVISIPAHVVGDRTAKAARARGLRRIATVANNASQIVQDLSFRSRTRVLFLAGVDRKPVIENALREAGIAFAVVETYRAVPAASLDEEAVEGFRAGRIDAVAHFSRRSAALFAGLAEKAGVLAAARNVRHFCLSEDVARGLADLATQHAVWPETPDMTSMMRLIGTGASGEATSS